MARKSLTATAIVVIVSAFFAVLYASGILTTLGHASIREYRQGFVTTRTSPLDIGLKNFFLWEGWEIYVDYRVECRAGSLRVGLMETFAPVGHKVHLADHLSGNRSGRVTFKAPKAAFYTFYHESSVLYGPRERGPYSVDLDYTITWGILLQ